MNALKTYAASKKLNAVLKVIAAESDNRKTCRAEQPSIVATVRTSSNFAGVAAGVERVAVIAVHSPRFRIGNQGPANVRGFDCRRAEFYESPRIGVMKGK